MAEVEQTDKMSERFHPEQLPTGVENNSAAGNLGHLKTDCETMFFRSRTPTTGWRTPPYDTPLWPKLNRLTKCQNVFTQSSPQQVWKTTVQLEILNNYAHIHNHIIYIYTHLHMYMYIYIYTYIGMLCYVMLLCNVMLC